MVLFIPEEDNLLLEILKLQNENVLLWGSVIFAKSERING